MDVVAVFVVNAVLGDRRGLGRFLISAGFTGIFLRGRADRCGRRCLGCRFSRSRKGSAISAAGEGSFLRLYRNSLFA